MIIMKKVLLLLSCTAVLLSAPARDINKQEAQSIANSFFGISGTQQTQKMRCAMRSGQQQQADYYVFNRGNNGGFVIVSGDDRAYSILGYSESGTFDPDNMPEQMGEWMEQYSQQMAYLRSNSNSLTPKAPNRAAIYTPVAPLLGKTAWNQLEPYNLMTPYYVGTTHSATGCAATAMAQVFYLNKWPKQGRGQHTYTPDGWSREVSVDFSQSEYQWDLMQPTYDETSSEEEQNAVALLMRDCGVAIDMIYGAVSGAMSDAWPMAMIDYFDYDKGLSRRTRQYYTQEEWNATIRNEIDNNRAVFAGGFSSTGGHAFVFDGYDAEGLIHVNWGWSGVSNGYFRTSALTPAVQGTGGSNGGYNYRQSIITGICAPQAESELTPELVSSERTKATPAETDLTNKVALKLTGKITNYGWCDITADLGFGVFDDKDNLILSIPANESDVSLAQEAHHIGITATEADLHSLAEGEYILCPVAVEHGGKRWTKIRNFSYTKPNYLKLTVKDGKMTFATPETYSLTAKRVSLNSKLYSNVKANITGTVFNYGDMEYNGAIKAALYSKQTGEKVAESDEYIEPISTGDSVDVEITSKYTIAAGSYTMALIDENKAKLCDPIDVEMLEAPIDAAVIEQETQLSFEDNNNVKADSIALTAHIKCSKGIFGGTLTVYIYDEDGVQQYGCLNPQYMFAEAGQSVDVHFNGTMENAQPGKRYKAVMINADDLVYIQPLDKASCIFTIATTTAIKDITTGNNSDRKNTLYTIDGRKLNTSHPAKGLYINGEGKKIIVK